MKVVCVQENLSRALATVNRAVATRSTLPVLSNVLLSADRAMLKLSATNMELATTVNVGCKVESEGEITVPARLLTDFISQLDADPVTLDLNEDSLDLNVSSGRYHATIKGIAATDFPPLPAAERGPTLDIDPIFLKGMIDATVLATATDDSRPVLAGVCIVLRPDELVLAAADGYRLAIKRLEADTGVDRELQVIVPRPSMVELSRILGDNQENVEMVITPQHTHVVFKIGQVELTSHLIEGQFPNFDQLIPAEFTTRIVINREEMAQSARISSIFARGGSNVIRLDVPDNKAETITVSAKSADLGENSGEMSAEIEGDPTNIAFNARFLSDCIGVIDSEQLEIQLSGPTSPGLIRGTSDSSYTHVIMPMHMAR